MAIMVNDVFRTYLEEAIGSENALVAFSSFDMPALTSVRYNPFKRSQRMAGDSVDWNENGVILPERPQFTLDPLLHAGAYYVQDSSSMFVGHIFRKCISLQDGKTSCPIRVLDLCAAPGGKSTDLAASLRDYYGDDFLLVSNEVMKQRSAVLAENMAKWGDPNVVVTSDDPRAFASLDGYFDVIVADVPCSGEGMFRKDEEAQRQWSEDNVSLCQARQRRIIADMWPALREGGILIYSTCTFNRYENDDNVEWIAAELDADVITSQDWDYSGQGVIKTDQGYSLVPGHVVGEGQYCAALRKKTTGSHFLSPVQSMSKRNAVRTADYPSDLRGLFRKDVDIRQKGQMLIALPSSLTMEVQVLESYLHVISAGCAIGVMKGKTMVPDADLALSMMLQDNSFPCADVDLATALAFLHKDPVFLPEMDKGYVLISFGGLPLGFVKNLGNRCNNLHPQGRRIRMDIRK